ncbi:hypothetical protein B0J13DRAFT_294959 [Dactylonectria estremocensis]|uniref:LysM domain-containing protein n=1 Tax=Dactylonectria estremocensis TaxID=1079267 RepID=A0A9P9CZ61_9HYPO|nr:hypothetical protein B0J13DRAFT_294959 [Dactylonectria estremocensis]
MILLLFLCQISLTSAFCTDVALWAPWRYETVDMAADVLNLPNYDKFTELNQGLNPAYIRVGQTYTMPFTDVNPPATWMTVGGCTPLLELNSDTMSHLSTDETTARSQRHGSLVNRSRRLGFLASRSRRPGSLGIRS